MASGSSCIEQLVDKDLVVEALCTYVCAALGLRWSVFSIFELGTTPQLQCQHVTFNTCWCQRSRLHTELGTVNSSKRSFLREVVLSTTVMADKKLSARAEKEIRDLQAAGGEGRATGEQRGGVKKTETKVAGLACKLEEQAKVVAAKRQAEMQKTRQMHTPKSGSKSCLLYTSPSPRD